MSVKSSYKTEMEMYSDLKGKISLPKYQRRLVWSKSQKKEFLESIHKNFPVGSLLLYKFDHDDKYSLIDGLQRYSTLNDFEENKSKYFNFEEHFIEIKEHLTKEVNGKLATDFSKTLNKICIEVFSNDLNDLSYCDLYDAVKNDSCYGVIQEYIKSDTFHKLQERIKKSISDYVDLDKLKIPCIYFTGDHSQLAEIFERLNRGGVKLSKYQIFASQWEKYTLNLSETSAEYNKEVEYIISVLSKRYEELNETRNIEIEGYEKEKFEFEKKNFSF